MRPLVFVDHFAGAGGTSTGAIRALEKRGREYKLLAINHWPEALATHKLNHPDVFHIQEDLGAIDPREAMDRFDLGRTVDILWTSPECTEHSYSRGGRPISGQSRATAWYSLRWADQLNIKKVIFENVGPVRRWGPTDANGKPIKARRGETWNQYLGMWETLGYRVWVQVLNAADYGAAQTRKRLFFVAIKGSRPRFQWPMPTHGKTNNLFGLPPHRGAKEIIDWSLRGRSIFNRDKPMARKSLERIVIGGEKFWTALRPYMPILRQHLLARGIDETLPTIVAGGQHIGLAEPVLTSISHGDMSGRVRSVSDPLPTVTGSRELGIAEAFIAQVAHGDSGGRGNTGRVRSVEEPLGTVTGSPGHGVVQAFVIGAGGPTGQGAGRSVEEPLATILSRNHRGVVEPFVMVNRTNNMPKSIDEPLAPLNTGGNMGVVEPFLTKYHGDHGALGDGAKRVKSVDEPLGTVDTSNRFGLVEPVPFILPHRVFDKMTADSVEDPLRTVTTTGRDIALVEPILLPHRTFDNMVDTIEDLLRTVTAKGTPTLVEPVLTEGVEEVPAGPPVIIAYNGERPGQTPRTHSIEEPLPTVCGSTKGLSSPVLLKYSRTGGAHSTEEPLDTLTTKPRYGLVAPEVLARLDVLPIGAVTEWGLKIAPNLYLDILFRMLRVHELGQGQGFERDYKFTGTVEEQVKQVGNAVEVHMAEALVNAVLA